MIGIVLILFSSCSALDPGIYFIGDSMTLDTFSIELCYRVTMRMIMACVGSAPSHNDRSTFYSIISKIFTINKENKKEADKQGVNYWGVERGKMVAKHLMQTTYLIGDISEMIIEKGHACINETLVLNVLEYHKTEVKCRPTLIKISKYVDTQWFAIIFVFAFSVIGSCILLWRK